MRFSRNSMAVNHHVRFRNGDKIIVIDPGATFLYLFRLKTLIPKSEWEGITHIFVTHGDPDHYWHRDRVAKVSGAQVICNKTMIKTINGNTLMLGPRNKGLTYTTNIKNLHPISVGETIALDDMSVTGLKTTHALLLLNLAHFGKP